MYHYRQKLSFSSPSSVVLPEMSKNESGKIEYQMVNQAQKALPDVETTDLKALLDAGVSVKHVDTKIMRSGSVITDMTPEPDEDKTEEKGDE